MKKILFACVLILSLILTGCTTNSTDNMANNNNDNSGSISDSTDTPTPPQIDESTPNDPEPNKPQSDTLPNGYLDETDDTEYIISEQLGEPQEIITTIETANFYYTIFIPTLDPELSAAIDQADSFYLCLYEEGKLYDSPFCALVIYSKPITLSCMPSTGGKLNILITNGITVSSHSVKQGDTVFNSTGISAISEANGRNLVLSDSTLVEFSDSTFILSQEKNDVLIDTLNLYF